MSEGVFLLSVHHVCGHVCGTQARVLDQSRNPTLLENEVFNLDRFFQIPEANPSKCVHSTFPEKSFKWIVCFLTF